MKTAARLGALVLLLGLCEVAFEQERPNDRPAKDGIVIDQQSEVRMQVNLEHEPVSHACEAQLEFEYYQKGSEVHVESTLTNEICDASSGSYELQVRYRSDDGESQTKEFSEVWDRSDAAPIITTKDYFIADDIDIVRVRLRHLRCKCADSGEQ